MVKDRLSTVLDRVDKDIPCGIRKSRATYDPDKGHVVLWYEPARHAMPAEFTDLRRHLAMCSDPDVAVRICQSSFAQDILESEHILTRCVKDCCVVNAPMILPFISPACVTLKDNQIRISMPAAEGAGIFASLHLNEILRDYMRESYGVDLRILVEVDEQAAADGYNAPDAVEKELAAARAEQPAPQFVAETPRKQRRKREHRELRISELTEGVNAAIEVKVVCVEQRKVKDGELTISNICVTDYTGSVIALLFTRKNDVGPEVPRPDTWVRLEGRYEEDSYSHSHVFRVSNILPSSHVDRADDAELKRVELHAHTKMSALDAVTGIKELVSRAAAWGHEAVAITDHGVTQAFPAAASAAGDKIKLIYGCEAYMFDDMTPPWSGDDDGEFDSDYISVSLRTTGESPFNAEIVQIGAVRVSGGQIGDTFSTYVAIKGPVPVSLTQEAGITDEMLSDAPSEMEALSMLHRFCAETPIAAHDQITVTGFLHTKASAYGIRFEQCTLDTMLLSRIAFPDAALYKLGNVASDLGIAYNARHAGDVAMCTAKVMLACFKALRARGAETLRDAAGLMDPERLYRSAKKHHIILLCRDKQGMIDLNRLVSNAHIKYLSRKKPGFPRSEINSVRSHLIIGSACESGDLYRAAVAGQSDAELIRLAKFYNYLEIQPVGNNRFLVDTGVLRDEEAIRDINRRIVSLGERLGIPVAATCDVHFLDPEDECFRRVLQSAMGYARSEQPPLYFRTTAEMLDEFSYLGPDKAQEVVVEVPRRMASQVESFELLPEETAMPVLDGAAEAVESMAYENARKMYGEPLPEIVEARLKRELGSIIGHGFAVLYYSAHKLVKKSNDDGYLVGSRGSVGSSLTATMTGITEVNPLPPHYVCPNCCHSDFGVDTETYGCGVDLPDAVCPVCGTPYRKEGFNIPFEVFLGIDADKVPDIDLNFSGEYQNKAHKYTEELFGKSHVFRAGTISALKERNVYGYIRHYAEDTGSDICQAEITRLQKGISGVKKTTGQHPGGMVIVPRGHEIYEYTAVQWPANEQGSDFVTTHFDFRSMHDVLIKLDILGHDAPTIMRLIQDITGIDPLDIPIGDPETLRLFSSIEPLGIDPGDLFGITKGTLGVPEFGTSFVRQMLEDTKPRTVEEIIRICGLSHGTGVWLGNAQELIRNGTCVLGEAICARDDIMNYLVAMGVDKREAFFIMENTRKGKVAKKGFSDHEAALLKEAHVPEWFLEACRRIEYLFPKGHAVAYCLMALRIAYCKVHHMAAFYATYFDVNTETFRSSFVEDGLPGIRRRYEELQHKGNSATDSEKSALTVLEICAEMYLRGLSFLRVDLEKSDPVRFLVEDGGLRMPFVVVPKLGEKVAHAIAEERKKASFLSVEDLKRRTKLSSAAADYLQKSGALAGLSDQDQMSLFDFH